MSASGATSPTMQTPRSAEKGGLLPLRIDQVDDKLWS